MPSTCLWLFSLFPLFLRLDRFAHRVLAYHTLDLTRTTILTFKCPVLASWLIQ